MSVRVCKTHRRNASHRHVTQGFREVTQGLLLPAQGRLSFLASVRQWNRRSASDLTPASLSPSRSPCHHIDYNFCAGTRGQSPMMKYRNILLSL